MIDITLVNRVDKELLCFLSSEGKKCISISVEKYDHELLENKIVNQYQISLEQFPQKFLELSKDWRIIP